MSKRVLALLTTALLLGGVLAAPAVSASIFSQDTMATEAQADDDFPLVSGLLDLLRPGPRLAARALGAPSSTVSLDGGLLNDAFVLHCQVPDTASDKLRIRWSDDTGSHVWTLLQPISLPTCEDGTTQSYDALLGGTCDGDLSAARVHLEKTTNPDGSLSQSGSLLITGACSLDNGEGGAFESEAQGCLVFGGDPDACDSSRGGPSFPGDMTGNASVGTTAVSFDLDCTDPAAATNALTVTWSGNTFTLGSITSVACGDQTPYRAPNKKNPFDTQRGHGTGTCNGEATSIGWTFQDNGEPSSGDRVSLEIPASSACPGLLINDASATEGNIQAHPA